ncbi:MAG: L-aspartate oxidase [candidate division KSB1 bacterium]|nr:L-aspartate oxidase [candidate division KSB1 bacterium]
MAYESDFLIIGSGIAGLSAALKLSRVGTVAIATKKEKAESNTNYAQGGIASVFDADDSFDQHIKDTLATGAGLSNPKAVSMIVERGPALINELFDLGVPFTKRSDGEFDLGREGGHQFERIVHVRDHTGQDVEQTLLNAVKENPNISLYEDHVAIDLITEHHVFSPGSLQQDTSFSCWGAYVLDEKGGQVKRFMARATILATGGCGQVYLHTTNPGIATGDGVAMCYRAGVAIANMEFMQFHPTSLFHPQAKSFLISEALRGYGAVLVNRQGETFVDKFHRSGSLAPRDVVARAIDSEMKKSGESCVYLNVSHKNAEETRQRFPKIYSTCKQYKIDITREPIPVVPAAHYSCGGVVTDLEGRTSLSGLFACGEVSCTGVHGANRLASNSLLEALVFADQCVNAAKSCVKNNHNSLPRIPLWDDAGTFNSKEWVLISHDKMEIKNLMWDYVGIVRSTLRLERALSRVRLVGREIENFYRRTTVAAGLIELRNLATVAQLIIQSALLRKESRGLHYTTDYPQKNDTDYLKDTILQKRVI